MIREKMSHAMVVGSVTKQTKALDDSPVICRGYRKWQVKRGKNKGQNHHESNHAEATYPTAVRQAVGLQP